MNSIVITTKKSKSIDYYIYFDEWSGEILLVSTDKLERSDPFLKTQDLLARHFITGESNHKNYYVFVDYDGTPELVKRSHVFKLSQAENDLFIIPRNQKNWDIEVKIERQTNLLTVQINTRAIAHMLRFVKRASLKVEGERNLNLYVIKRNQPDWLIDTIEIDAAELIKHGVVTYDVRSILDDVDYDDIDLLTRRNFREYTLKVI